MCASPKTILSALSILVLFLSCPRPVAATQAAPATAVATAIRVEVAPQLDGRIDDPVWADAPVIGGFIEREPVEGVLAADSTEVRLVYTGEALYIGARMRGNPADIRADVTRRDVLGNTEQLIISLDTYGDRRTAYTFIATAAGGRVDYYHASDSENDRNFSFDAVWQVETSIGLDGWTAEMRIPFSQLRFNPGDVLVWGLNVTRVRPALQERSYWQLVKRDDTGWSSRMGELRGISGIRPRRRIELLPYASSTGTMVSGNDEDDPFAAARDVNVQMGGDLKVGLGPNLTLDATFNPDFGQLDADPAVVNLSAFEVFFSERRPFFTEGAQLLNFGNLFYSRRIGAPPHGFPDGDYAESVGTSTILGAAKLTGRLPSGLSIGALAALTDKESVATFEAGSQRYGRSVIEPMTAYGAVRVQQEFGPAASTVGAMLTGVRRDLGGDDALGGILAHEAFSGGIDGRIRWAKGMYDVSWLISGTHVQGSEQSILRQQLSSRRYFQRPDADHLEVDSSRTSLSGYRAAIGHSRTSGEHWLWDIDLWAESPGFEPNDFGSFGLTDGVGGFAAISYRETTPGPLFRNYRAQVMTEQEVSYGRERTVAWHGLNLNAQLKNFWTTEIGFDYNPRVFDQTLTRGGPLMRRSGFRGGFFGIETPSGGRVQGDLWTGGGTEGDSGWRFWINPSVRFQPNPRLELAIEPEYERVNRARQYVTTLGGGPASTYDMRYVFGSIEYSELSVQLRANYAIGTDLTVEAYVEPFASAGQYPAIGELAAPRTSDMRVYGTDGSTLVRQADGQYRVTDGASSFTLRDPSFHVRSFRSNLVLRWEWRPGSTLFVVWQQNRAGSGRPSERVGASDLLRSVQSEGDNQLAIKATYWMPW